ncbi:MAG: DUF3500 domain-containing protein [Armatimonadetes bacterium]|nr:DUF3500 domain-containing protein [Armatimonadota bacterium]
MKSLCAALVVMSALWPPHRQSPMTDAAIEFVASLSAEERARAVFPASSPERSTWMYVPGARKGLCWSELSSGQKEKARALLRASLSKPGFEKVEAIRSLESVLREMENNPSRDPEKYWFAFYGEPSPEAPWLWRYEGHHVSLTFACRGGVTVASTPQFLGSNPAEIRSGERKGERVLGEQQDLAFAFVASLDDRQRSKAIVASDPPPDIVTSNARRAVIAGRLGLSSTELSKGQRGRLMALLRSFAQVQAPAEANRRMKKAEGDDIVFAWMGTLDPRGRHYFRVQGTKFVLEFDDTQNEANHIHTVWRDFDEDFGGDALLEHYRESHFR